MLDGLAFEGVIRAVLLVENLGAWRDLSPPPGWLLAHVPGWDTATVGHMLDRIAGVPVVHFGDLDPNGVRIMLHLRRRVPNLKWFLPEFWFELVDVCGLPTRWPEDLDLDFAPVPVRDLAARALARAGAHRLRSSHARCAEGGLGRRSARRTVAVIGTKTVRSPSAMKAGLRGFIDELLVDYPH